jgi:hypothetical protein
MRIGNFLGTSWMTDNQQENKIFLIDDLPLVLSIRNTRL